MTPNQIHNTYKQIVTYLSRGRLKNAFEQTNTLNNELQSAPHRESLHNIQTSYKYMLQYFIDGVNDPERKSIYNKLIAQLFIIASQIREELLTRDSNNFEFLQKRYFPFTPQLTVEKVLLSLNRSDKKEVLIEANVDDEKQFEQIEVNFENAVRFLFNYFWLKPTYDASRFLSIFNFIINDDYKDSIAKGMVVSALTLNIWRTFDESKVQMLLDACKSNDVFTRQRALVGLCFVLAKYNRFIPYFPTIRNRLILMTDNESTAESLQNIIIQIIATTETEQISKKLQEEIFPELMKLRPMMEKGLTDENLLSTDEWGEINPEWQEMIEKSGASDKIQEFAEMEMSGADVYMSTFSMLKSFPFFSEFSNWFLPFDPNHSAVNKLFQSNEKSLITAFLNSNIMCNSDRYSFCMSVLQMPDMQRNLMKKSFSQAAEQMEEIKKEETLYSPQVHAKAVAKHYIQDLFRFFKLNPNRNDFTDMFSMSLILHKTYLFDLLSVDDELKLNIAEYYFIKKLYPQALELFEEIEQEDKPSAVLYQKIGYAYQQTSQLFKALKAYKKADLIQPDDFWTIRKTAMCYKLTGDAENALKAYRHAHHIKPENLSVRLQIVNCLMELKQHDEALSSITEIQNDYPNNQRVLRAMILTSFKAKNLAQAHYFTSILLENNELFAYDFMIAGHIEWCMNKNQEAKKNYNKALFMLENDWDTFVKLFKQNKELLVENEVDEQDIPLILDALDYNKPAETVIV